MSSHSDISISRRGETAEAWEFDVEIRNGESITTHIVSVPKAYFSRFQDSFVSPSELVEESFRFLLAREPKESILGEFVLSQISQYFPEYERELGAK